MLMMRALPLFASSHHVKAARRLANNRSIVTPATSSSSPSLPRSPDRNNNGSSAETNGDLDSMQFKKTGEEQVYGRYLTVYDRTIQFTAQNGETKDVQYDIVGHPRASFLFTVVMPFHPATSEQGSKPQVTLVKEYCQGPNSWGYCLPSGCFEAHKHGNVLECARAEMSEEAHLQGGEFIRLIPDDHPGMAEVKWCANRFVPFLVIDPQVDPNPGSRDAEEHIQVLRVDLDQLQLIIKSGDMMLPSIATCHLALEQLRDRGLV